MKTKFYALLGSAVLIAQAQANGPHGGGAFSARAPAAHSAAPHSGPARFGASLGAPTIYAGQRFSPTGLRAPPLALPQHYANSSRRAAIENRQFTPANRDDRFNRRSDVTNRPFTNGQRQGTRQNTNSLPPNWRNHVVAQHSSNWHHDWDRGRDHWWHGHHCRFINGSWAIFDVGFYPWWSDWYPYGAYPYSYYAYPYSYGPGEYDYNPYQGEEYYQQSDYNSNQSTDSIIAPVQERLAEEGYYRGKIDGAVGPVTRRAIARYQRDQRLRSTGYLTANTLIALGLPRVTSN